MFIPNKKVAEKSSEISLELRLDTFQYSIKQWNFPLNQRTLKHQYRILCIIGIPCNQCSESIFVVKTVYDSFYLSVYSVYTLFEFFSILLFFGCKEKKSFICYLPALQPILRQMYFVDFQVKTKNTLLNYPRVPLYIQIFWLLFIKKWFRFRLFFTHQN